MITGTLPRLRLALLSFFLCTGFCSAEERALQIFWVDVEGGAGTLIVTPEKESILVDTGMPGGRDPGRIHRVAREVAGLDRIDHLVVSHFHLDHYGGAAELAEMIPIGTVYDNGIPDQNPDNPRDTRFHLLIRPYREFKAKQRQVLKPGEVIPLRQSPDGPRLQVRCLAAMQEVFQPGDARSREENPRCAEVELKPKDTSDNANSIVLLLEYGDFRFFNGGDLTWNIEAQLACPRNLIGTVDVYQVTHHGLDSSNNPVLVHSLAPTVSVMSNGIRKGCQPQTFVTLKNTPSIQAMYQIHKNLRDDREHNTLAEHIANLEEQCEANHIELRVHPSGQQYTVSIPATGHARTFLTQSR